MATKIYQFCEMTLIDIIADFLHGLGVMVVFWRSENMEFDTFPPLSLWQWQPFLLFPLNFFRARCFFNSRNDTVLFVQTFFTGYVSSMYVVLFMKVLFIQE